MEKSEMTRKKVKIVQITNAISGPSGDYLYALDSDGCIWKKHIGGPYTTGDWCYQGCPIVDIVDGQEKYEGY